MSVAANMNDGADSDLLRAQRAHEPSMEEILASIRAIIADERDPALVPEAPSPPPFASREPTKPGPQIVYSSNAPRAPFVEPPPAPTVVWSREAAAPPPPPPQPAAPETPLISQQVEHAVSDSFQALTESMVEHGREAAEEMARDMLRPMLKDWLDQNLPSMVERLVRAEIQRVTSGRR